MSPLGFLGRIAATMAALLVLFSVVMAREEIETTKDWVTVAIIIGWMVLILCVWL